jgi:uncharacterized delta-60 repeat protein
MRFRPGVESLETRCLLSFGAGGIVLTNLTPGSDSVTAVAVQPDGKVVAAGQASSSFGLARYNADGSLDTSFNGTGTATALPPQCGATGSVSLVLQADGKIVVAGGSQEFGLARFNSNGTLDAGFGTQGLVATAFSALPSAATAMTEQADGKIVLVGNEVYGYSQTIVWVSPGRGAPPIKEVITTPLTHVALARYNPDGSLDRTFGSHGLIVSSFGTKSAQDGAVGVAVDASGRILVTATVGGASAVLRYQANGSLDATFASGGKDILGISSLGKGIALEPDGTILIAGSVFTGTSTNFALERLNPDGSPYAAFGTKGIVTTAFGPDYFGTTYAQATSLAVNPSSGQIVVAGYVVNTAMKGAFAVARFSANGSLDTTFGSGGTVWTDASGTGQNGWAFAVAVQTDGDIIAAGSASPTGSDYEFALIRYNTDGSLDASQPAPLAAPAHNAAPVASAPVAPVHNAAPPAAAPVAAKSQPSQQASPSPRSWSSSGPGSHHHAP